MAVPENRNIKWTVENSDPSIRKKSAFFGGGDSAASSHVGAVPNGKLSRQPNAKPTRARWAALAAALSMTAVAFLVLRCFNGLHIQQPDASTRWLAETSLSSGPLDACRTTVSAGQYTLKACKLTARPSRAILVVWVRVLAMWAKRCRNAGILCY